MSTLLYWMITTLLLIMCWSCSIAVGDYRTGPETTGGDPTEDPCLIVNTHSGRVRGMTSQSATGKQVNVWNSIPFAQPPIGDLRFRHPKSMDPRGDVVRDAQALPNCCWQTMWNANTELSEDCLYLSVTPSWSGYSAVDSFPEGQPWKITTRKSSSPKRTSSCFDPIKAFVPWISIIYISTSRARWAIWECWTKWRPCSGSTP